MKSFAEKLTGLRKERGLTQATVAKDLGVSLGIICFWEANKSDPTATNVAKVARYFNVSADFLLGIDDAE
ncbi:MAG: helix-turn-helix transcriptional regulator [Clostridia bacterium]|nr:helix-turn-helix transcriptional regulator [Clostridia bacterium]